MSDETGSRSWRRSTAPATAPVPSAAEPAAAAGPGLEERRWLILAVIGIAQLMVVLDATIVNIVLPSAQRALGLQDRPR